MQPESPDGEDAPTVADLCDRPGPATEGKVGPAGAPAEPPDLFAGSTRRFYANLGDA